MAKNSHLTSVFLMLLSGMLVGCAVGPEYAGPPPLAVAQTWQAPVPHAGKLADLALWWQQFDDPALDALQAAAQAHSATLAQAAAAMAQAQAQAQAAGAAAQPVVNVTAGAQRGTVVVGTNTLLASQANAVTQASWEFDLWGRVRRERAAAVARVAGRRANWHEARVSVAAETAAHYLQLRHCEALRVLMQAEQASRTRTAQLTQQMADAGLAAPVAAALAQAGADDAASRAQAYAADCEIAIKGLVALTGLAEPVVRDQLAATRGRLPRPAQLEVATVPAALLAQRPDLAAAEREVAAASAEIGLAQADRYPRLTLHGSIGPLRVQTGAGQVNLTTWSLGPALTLPVWDGGRRKAKVEAAQAAYAAAVSQLQARARQAVREVEEALVRLEAAGSRVQVTDQALHRYRLSAEATLARWRAGLGTALDAEEAQRQVLQAEAACLGVQREHVAAWIALYRALGGGWRADA